MNALDELAFGSALASIRAIRNKEISSRELLEHFLRRVERRGPALNAIVTLDPERALRRAEAADAALASGEVWGPLHGLPVTVKDTFETEGLRTTAGVPALSAHVPAADAVAVARLRAAGAVIFGKSNTPTWASDWQTTNPIFGRTNNPYDLARSPGGSSGGSAAALAAGLTALELGSDIGGSIRVPSHWSGVCGHKPSHGVVPQRGHLPGPPGTLAEADLNVVGPLARTPDDLALAFELLAGPLPEVAVGWRLALPRSRAERLGDFRVATWLEEAAYPLDAEMLEVIRSAIAALRAEGAHIVEGRPDVDFAEAVPTYLELMMPLNTRFEDEAVFEGLLRTAAALPADAATLLAHGIRAHVTRHRDWLVSHERRERIRARWAAFFQEFDVLLCPVTLTPAILHDDRFFPERTVCVNGVERPYLDQIAWPGLITLALLPSTVIPVGRTGAGLPVGVQIVGPHLEDRTPLVFAQRVWEVLGAIEPPPDAP